MTVNLGVEINGVVGQAELLDALAPATAAALRGALPLTGTLRHSRWSGWAGHFQLPSIEWQTQELEHPVCSLYPGTIAVRPDQNELVISYGTAEYRSALGVEYVTRVGRLTIGRDELLKALAAMHSAGDAQLRIQAISG